mmetsp:Transcript_86695/g.167925  ORF Transcript_86695/g.167925 Transcript_86695/m.167925 type:complete len:432 (+) Transcript_86695:37-1332(+)
MESQSKGVVRFLLYFVLCTRFATAQPCIWTAVSAKHLKGSRSEEHVRRPYFTYPISAPGGGAPWMLQVCPKGLSDCDDPAQYAEALYWEWVGSLRSTGIQVNLTAVDHLRQLMIAAEPYRSTVTPMDACAELKAPSTRSELIELLLLKHYGGKASARYLEIGCFEDSTFEHVRTDVAKTAVCVDPATGGTHRMTSDDFFNSNTPHSKGPWDVIFVDGLHESGQAERDVRNALAVLAPGGVVVVHDSNPRSAVSAAWPKEWPHEPPFNWNGDTWRAVARLRSDADLDVVTADIDHGCALVRRRNERRESQVSTAAPILPNDLDWAGFEKNRNSWLGLMAASDVLKWFDSAIQLDERSKFQNGKDDEATYTVDFTSFSLGVGAIDFKRSDDLRAVASSFLLARHEAMVDSVVVDLVEGLRQQPPSLQSPRSLQ